MRFSVFSLATAIATLALSPLLARALSSDASYWASQAAKARDGIITLTSESYDELLTPSDGSGERDYSVTVILTALPAQFKCQPCNEFDPLFHQVANSWRKESGKDVRDKHFFALLDFTDGQAIYQRLGLTTAPTVYFHPATSGPNKSDKPAVAYDLNRNGLFIQPFHAWTSSTTPRPFELHKPFNPVPLIVIPLTVATIAYALYALHPYLVPIVQSRIIWGVASAVLILTFTSGYMWNKIKNAPYVSAGQNGRISWIAGGYQNQLGLESQVVGSLYGLLAFSVLALTVFVPAQGSPVKQRIGVYVWLAMLIVLFSLLFRLFRLKNGGYPFHLF